MKKIFPFLVVFCIFLHSYAQSPPPGYTEAYKASWERTAWWAEARFGMFIHFGAYAVPARGEWVKTTERMTNEEYRKYVDAFNPVDADMREWARLAREAGMKYAVMTAKHHDGFCLFDSRLTDYTTGKTIGRDLVREFLDAFREEGLRVGLYYSIIDWYHPDYPKYNDRHHPMRGREEYRDEQIDWDNYLRYMHGQIEELTTQYGTIDILWMDFSYDEMSGEKWESTRLVDMIRQNQPGIIINNRLQGSGEGTIGLRDFYIGDFDTPEQGIPEEEPHDEFGNPMRWETCLTLNNNWGYALTDNNWKSPTLVIHTLIDCVSKNGNLLLNVGPDGRGNIPPESVAILKEVGKWMRLNGESIYGCGRADLKRPAWGRFTQKGNELFLHWMYPQVGHINMRGYADKTESVIVLPTGAEAPTARSWWGAAGEENFFINVNRPTYQTFALPDPHSTVFKLKMKNEK